MNHKPPNIIFILSDDQGAWSLGCAGNSDIKTPNIDSLAKTGMMFNNFFCSSPVCSPARATLMTGRIPSQHGVHDWIAAGDTIAKYEPVRNGELTEYLKGQAGYTDFLYEAGYECGISGKWHLGDSHHRQKSFDFWEVHSKGGGTYYNAPMIKDGDVYEEPEYVTDKITDNALKWLEQQETKEKPFYLSVHYTAPHSPWTREQHPKEIYDDYFKNCTFESVPKGLEVPDWVQYTPLSYCVKARQKVLSGYFAAITAMDNNIGRIIKYLEENDLREDTLIIFTSDNGMNMGHHGIFGKGNATFPINMFEESIKVPFIALHPGTITQNSKSNSMLSQYDFFPTILDYVGIHNENKKLPGKSFAGLLKGTNQEINEGIVVFDEYGLVRMMRTPNWKYVFRIKYGDNELYNLKDDPHEQINQIKNEKFKKIKNDMHEKLIQWFNDYVDPNRDGANEIVTGSGQYGLCGTYADERETFSKARVEHLL